MRNSNKKRNTVDNDKFLREEELPQCLTDVLTDSTLCEEFMTYLKSKLAEENLMFYQTVSRFETLSTEEHLNKMGPRIIEKFVKEESLYCINIAALTRTTLLDLTVFEANSFAQAKSEVYILMSSNFFDSFKRRLAGREEKRLNKNSSSFDSFVEILGNLNLKDDLEEIDDCGCENITQEVCCDTRKAMIQNQINKVSKKQRGSMTKQMLSRLLGGKNRKGSEGEVTTSTKRAQKAFKRIFNRTKSLKDQRRISFWEDEQ